MKIYRRKSDQRKFGLESVEHQGQHFNQLAELSDDEQLLDVEPIDVPDDFDETFEELH